MTPSQYLRSFRSRTRRSAARDVHIPTALLESYIQQVLSETLDPNEGWAKLVLTNFNTAPDADTTTLKVYIRPLVKAALRKWSTLSQRQRELLVTRLDLPIEL